MQIPERQIRAHLVGDKVRVYQAYNTEIALSAVAHGTFVSPPFKMERMTWIKPSFLYVMYRSGWAKKDQSHERILAIDITREGFDWALENGCLTTHIPELHGDYEAWNKVPRSVQIQWDPDRDLNLNRLPYRTIQIGLSRNAVSQYIDEWVKDIHDITDQVKIIQKAILAGDLEQAKALLPVETAIEVSETVAKNLMM